MRVTKWKILTIAQHVWSLWTAWLSSWLVPSKNSEKKSRKGEGQELHNFNKFQQVSGGQQFQLLAHDTKESKQGDFDLPFGELFPPQKMLQNPCALAKGSSVSAWESAVRLGSKGSDLLGAPTKRRGSDSELHSQALITELSLFRHIWHGFCTRSPQTTSNCPTE